MESFVFSVLTFLAISWFVQFVLGIVYSRALAKPQPGNLPEEITKRGPLPRIGIVMPLRGADPFLENAVRSVVENDYPNIELHIIIDSATDPAQKIVADVMSRVKSDNVHVSTLRSHLPTCSLVCSSLIQGFDTLAERCDLVAFCAADTVVPRGWYWHVVNALSDPQVGCTLGNRWYLPDEGRWGSLVRQLWNMGAAVIMWLCNIPWGGAAALRPADVRRSGLRNDWEHSLVEDVTIYNAMQRADLKLKFVPALTSVNREEIGLVGGFHFIRRQMMWARLYHPRWSFVVEHSLLGLATMVLPAAGVVTAAIQGDWLAAQWLGGGLAIYVIGLALIAVYMEHAMRGLLRAAGQEAKSMTFGQFVRMIPAIPLTQVLYPIAVLTCCVARYVDWRGIRYHIVGPGKVQMEEYKPFQPAPASAQDKTSI